MDCGNEVNLWLVLYLPNIAALDVEPGPGGKELSPL